MKQFTALNMRSAPLSFVRLFFVGMMLCAGLVNVLAESPSFKIFTTEDGLAHDSVNQIVRDSRGFLWFCTSEGLSRFDGTHFTNFTENQGLPHRNINTFLETRDSTYLIGTSAGLVVFNPNGKPYRWNVIESRLERDSAEPPMFQTFAPETEIRQKKSIISLIQDNSGTIWAGSALGLFKVEKKGESWNFQEYQPDKKLESGILSFLLHSNGDLIVGAEGGIFSVSPNGDFNQLLETGSGAMMEDRDGNIWTDSGSLPIGLRVFSYENGKLNLLKTYTQKDGLPANAFYFAIKQISDGRIFIGMHDGLCEFVPQAKENEPKFRLIQPNKVLALAEDSGGNLWMGTELFGAWKLIPNGFTIFGEADGFVNTDDIRSIYFAPDGEMYVPARPKKTLHFKDGKFQSVFPAGLVKRSWSWHFLDILSKDGEWWIPTEQGLLRFPKVNSIEDLAHTQPKIYSKENGLPGNEIFNMFEDSKGNIWFTIVSVENPLLHWDRQTDSIIHTQASDGLPKFNGPISFAEDLQGKIWFGHYFGGLSRYFNGKFQVFAEKEGLPQTQISDLLTDKNGRLWIGTSGRGLFRIDDTNAETPVFKNISTQDGLSSNQILCLTKDRFNRLYVGTGRGLNRIDQNGKIKIFTQDDGLPSNFITRCSADKNGFLWFVSRNTLVRFVPEEDSNLLPPSVYFDKISVNGVPQKISALGENNLQLADFSSNQNQFEINFFALTFGTGENIRYQYRLDDQDWSPPSDQQVLNLNLNSGQHFFEVRAVRLDGVTSEKNAVVSFKILSPIYLRWWFITLCVLALSLFIFSFYRYRISNLRAINEALTEAKLAEENLRKSKEERLAELEKVRSRIATDLHDDIGASLTQIAILSEVAQAQTKGNGATESLTKITDVSNELVGTMSDIVWSINPSKDHLSDLTQRMRRFASDSLAAKNIAFQFTMPEANREIIVNSNIRREMFLIFKESINNIIKHSGAKKVEIKLEAENDKLLLNIKDDGCGFEDDEEPIHTSIQMGGNGLLSMQKRAMEMDGDLEIASETGKGTTVKLTLPIEQNVKT